MPKPPVTETNQQTQRWGRGYHRDDGPSIVFMGGARNRSQRDTPRVFHMAWYREDRLTGYKHKLRTVTALTTRGPEVKESTNIIHL